jgi:hypothetical protein
MGDCGSESPASSSYLGSTRCICSSIWKQQLRRENFINVGSCIPSTLPLRSRGEFSFRSTNGRMHRVYHMLDPAHNRTSLQFVKNHVIYMYNTPTTFHIGFFLNGVRSLAIKSYEIPIWILEKLTLSVHMFETIQNIYQIVHWIIPETRFWNLPLFRLSLVMTLSQDKNFYLRIKGI